MHTETVRVILEAGVSPSKIADTIGTQPGQKSGPVHPINMVDDNAATKKLLEEWIAKEERHQKIERDATSIKAEAGAEEVCQAPEQQ